MTSHARSHTTLRNQLKEFGSKTTEEYNTWYAGLIEEEKEFIDGRVAAFEAKLLSDQEKLNFKGVKIAIPTGEETSKGKDVPNEITESEIAAMWLAIDSADVSGLDQDALRIFEYQGFDPKKILISLMKAKKRNGVADDAFKADILTLCAISIIKGSINNNNIKKISEEGQQVISRLETTYGIKRGSGRKEKPEIITISRIGATFPGKIIQLICAGKVQGRTFIGPFSSSSLPNFMRHQAFAAVIPRMLKQKTRDFLLSLVTAFSVDQSIQINPNKKEKMEPSSVFASQMNFVIVTHNSQYPPEHTKLAIFKTLNINYEELLPTAKRIMAIVGDVSLPSSEEFKADLLALE